MPRFRRSKQCSTIPWGDVLETITISPSLPSDDSTRGSATLSPEAAFAKGWETVMGNLAEAWRGTKDEADAKLAAQQPSGVQRQKS